MSTKLFQVLHDGPSRPMIRTPSGRLLSLSQFNKGRWETYEQEESDCRVIAEALNWTLLNAPEIISDWKAAEE